MIRKHDHTSKSLTSLLVEAYVRVFSVTISEIFHFLNNFQNLETSAKPAKY